MENISTTAIVKRRVWKRDHSLARRPYWRNELCVRVEAITSYTVHVCEKQGIVYMYITLHT